MKGIYQFLLLFIVILSYQLAKADLVQLNHESSKDRISQLTETLAQGSLVEDEPYRVCRRLNILRDYSDEKTKLYPRN